METPDEEEVHVCECEPIDTPTDIAIDHRVVRDDRDETCERVDTIHDEKREMLNERIRREHIRDEPRMDDREGDKIGAEEEEYDGVAAPIERRECDHDDRREGECQEGIILVEAVGDTEEREIKRQKREVVRLLPQKSRHVRLDLVLVRATVRCTVDRHADEIKGGMEVHEDEDTKYREQNCPDDPIRRHERPKNSREREMNEEKKVRHSDLCFYKYSSINIVENCLFYSSSSSASSPKTNFARKLS